MAHNLFCRIVIMGLATFGAYMMAGVGMVLKDANPFVSFWALASAIAFIGCGFLFAYQPDYKQED
jgi:hypothetical protein